MDGGSKREWGRKKGREWEHSRGGRTGRSDHIFSPPHYLYEPSISKENKERSTKTVQQGPQHTVLSHHSLTKANSLLYPSSNSILSLLTSSCRSIYPWFFPSPAPDSFFFFFFPVFLLFSLFITVAMVDVSKVIFESFISSSSHYTSTSESKLRGGLLADTLQTLVMKDNARHLRSHLRKLNWNTTDCSL